MKENQFQRIESNTPTFTKSKRQVGFEILRIISIFLICCIHLINYGGILLHSTNKIWLNLLYSIFLISVNTFVLISGYFLVKSKFSFKKIFMLWLQVVFYNLISFLIASIFLKQQSGVIFSVRQLLYCFLPVIKNSFWFFTAYFLMYLFSPFLNKILNHSSKKSLTLLIIGIFVLNFFISAKNAVGEIFNLSSGYSFLWFVELYLIAGYFRLYPLKFHRFTFLAIFIISTLLIWLMSILPQPNNILYNYIYSGFSYNDYLTLISSVAIFLFFKDITSTNIKLNNFVTFISSCTFGIYLFQESYIKPVIYFNILKVQNIYGSPFSTLYVLIFACCLFTMGLLFELLRKLLVKAFAPANKKIFAFSEKCVLRIKNKYFNNNSPQDDNNA